MSLEYEVTPEHKEEKDNRTYGLITFIDPYESFVERDVSQIKDSLTPLLRKRPQDSGKIVFVSTQGVPTIDLEPCYVLSKSNEGILLLRSINNGDLFIDRPNEGIYYIKKSADELESIIEDFTKYNNIPYRLKNHTKKTYNIEDKYFRERGTLNKQLKMPQDAWLVEFFDLDTRKLTTEFL